MKHVDILENLIEEEIKRYADQIAGLSYKMNMKKLILKRMKGDFTPRKMIVHQLDLFEKANSI